VRIGVVADTHVGEHLPELPAEVCEALAGVDLILHAGDITDPSALEVLRGVAPVVAVRGNHDRRRRHRDLPRDMLVRVGGVRIGLTHGHRPPAVEVPAILTSLVAGRPVLLGFDRTMRRRFPGADCVVVGHLHQPIHHRACGVLLFSPGAVFAPEHDPDYDWSGPRAMAYRRYRGSLPPEARRPSVGLIEVGPGTLRARVIPLRRPIRAPR
jgi:putative phosphoesterase